ncbi:unnamed protein product [Amoebophrya sp. A120]|nr:unnamed protein product [Amoebophrya sp. A120]|eukprot:GSA120T00023653001.1
MPGPGAKRFISPQPGGLCFRLCKFLQQIFLLLQLHPGCCFCHLSRLFKFSAVLQPTILGVVHEPKGAATSAAKTTHDADEAKHREGDTEGVDVGATTTTAGQLHQEEILQQNSRDVAASPPSSSTSTSTSSTALVLYEPARSSQTRRGRRMVGRVGGAARPVERPPIAHALQAVADLVYSAAATFLQWPASSTKSQEGAGAGDAAAARAEMVPVGEVSSLPPQPEDGKKLQAATSRRVRDDASDQDFAAAAPSAASIHTATVPGTAATTVMTSRQDDLRAPTSDEVGRGSGSPPLQPLPPPQQPKGPDKLEDQEDSAVTSEPRETKLNAAEASSQSSRGKNKATASRDRSEVDSAPANFPDGRHGGRGTDSATSRPSSSSQKAASINKASVATAVKDVEAHSLTRPSSVSTTGASSTNEGPSVLHQAATSMLETGENDASYNPEWEKEWLFQLIEQRAKIESRQTESAATSQQKTDDAKRKREDAQKTVDLENAAKAFDEAEKAFFKIRKQGEDAWDEMKKKISERIKDEGEQKKALADFLNRCCRPKLTTSEGLSVSSAPGPVDVTGRGEQGHEPGTASSASPCASHSMEICVSFAAGEDALIGRVIEIEKMNSSAPKDENPYAEKIKTHETNADQQNNDKKKNEDYDSSLLHVAVRAAGIDETYYRIFEHQYVRFISFVRMRRRPAVTVGEGGLNARWEDVDEEKQLQPVALYAVYPGTSTKGGEPACCEMAMLGHHLDSPAEDDAASDASSEYELYSESERSSAEQEQSSPSNTLELENKPLPLISVPYSSLFLQKDAAQVFWTCKELCPKNRKMLPVFDLEGDVLLKKIVQNSFSYYSSFYSVVEMIVPDGMWRDVGDVLKTVKDSPFRPSPYYRYISAPEHKPWWSTSVKKLARNCQSFACYVSNFFPVARVCDILAPRGAFPYRGPFSLLPVPTLQPARRLRAQTLGGHPVDLVDTRQNYMKAYPEVFWAGPPWVARRFETHGAKGFLNSAAGVIIQKTQPVCGVANLDRLDKDERDALEEAVKRKSGVEEDQGDSNSDSSASLASFTSRSSSSFGTATATPTAASVVSSAASSTVHLQQAGLEVVATGSVPAASPPGAVEAATSGTTTAAGEQDSGAQDHKRQQHLPAAASNEKKNLNDNENDPGRGREDVEFDKAQALGRTTSSSSSANSDVVVAAPTKLPPQEDNKKKETNNINDMVVETPFLAAGDVDAVQHQEDVPAQKAIKQKRLQGDEGFSEGAPAAGPALEVGRQDGKLMPKSHEQDQDEDDPSSTSRTTSTPVHDIISEGKTLSVQEEGGDVVQHASATASSTADAEPVSQLAVVPQEDDVASMPSSATGPGTTARDTAPAAATSTIAGDGTTRTTEGDRNDIGRTAPTEPLIPSSAVMSRTTSDGAAGPSTLQSSIAGVEAEEERQAFANLNGIPADGKTDEATSGGGNNKKGEKNQKSASGDFASLRQQQDDPELEHKIGHLHQRRHESGQTAIASTAYLVEPGEKKSTATTPGGTTTTVKESHIKNAEGDEQQLQQELQNESERQSAGQPASVAGQQPRGAQEGSRPLQVPEDSGPLGENHPAPEK